MVIKEMMVDKVKKSFKEVSVNTWKRLFNIVIVIIPFFMVEYLYERGVVIDYGRMYYMVLIILILSLYDSLLLWLEENVKDKL